MNNHIFCRTELSLIRADAIEEGVAIPKKLTALRSFRDQYFVEGEGITGEDVSACCAWDAKAKYISRLIDRKPSSGAPTLAEYREKVGVRRCRWCDALLPQTIDHYEHESGWPVAGMAGLQWLSIKCPGTRAKKCGYGWSLNKLGVGRPDFDLTAAEFAALMPKDSIGE